MGLLESPNPHEALVRQRRKIQKEGRLLSAQLCADQGRRDCKPALRRGPSQAWWQSWEDFLGGKKKSSRGFQSFSITWWVRARRCSAGPVSASQSWSLPSCCCELHGPAASQTRVAHNISCLPTGRPVKQCGWIRPWLDLIDTRPGGWDLKLWWWGLEGRPASQKKELW